MSTNAERSRPEVRMIICDRCGRAGASAQGQRWKYCFGCRGYTLVAPGRVTLSPDECTHLGLDYYGQVEPWRIEDLSPEQRVALADRRFPPVPHRPYRTPHRPINR